MQPDQEAFGKRPWMIVSVSRQRRSLIRLAARYRPVGRATRKSAGKAARRDCYLRSADAEDGQHNQDDRGDRENTVSDNCGDGEMALGRNR